ncbi:MAG: methyltransferase [Bacilli bacterium]|jgi:16S rRNA (guanine1207-N2)-methyltransferase|nr:methyltransferase [Bacilli bacterium]
MKQYFINNDNLKNEEKTLTYQYLDNRLCFKTNNGLFSKDELDYHSQILLNNIEVKTYHKILDLGCGYGFIGICLSKRYQCHVDFIDIVKLACDYTSKNCELNNITNYEVINSDGIKNDDLYDLICLNPPIHAGKEVCYALYQESLKHLSNNGELVIVIHKKHGALSTISFLESLNYHIRILYKKKGLFVVSIKNK